MDALGVEDAGAIAGTLQGLDEIQVIGTGRLQHRAGHTDPAQVADEATMAGGGVGIGGADASRAEGDVERGLGDIDADPDRTIHGDLLVARLGMSTECACL